MPMPMPMPLTYLFASCRLVPSERSLHSDGAPLRLGGRAFDTLVALVERRDRIVSKFDLLDIVWPNLVVEENNLQVHIVALRKLLGHPAIATIPGRGYRFTLPTTVEGVAVADLPSGAATGPSQIGIRAATTGSLPVLYGRDQELAVLLELLGRHEIVTVAGPGGIGKSCLARAAVGAFAATLPGGACWVDLASLTEAVLIANVVAVALGVASGAGEPMDAVIEALRSKPALVALDNAEHLLEGVADFIARLRAAAPEARLLVTSQEVLHIAGEHVFRPEPLALPDGDDPERTAASGAVALFVARARAADRNFVLDDANRAAVADVCRRLDGIPLALEMAAARMPLLGIEGLRSRLDERLKVLTLGDRRSPRRHQTLRAALEWSHGLLAPAEQAVLRRLGVFAGGFTLEAAQHVAADDEAIDPWDVLEHLGALVDKSLVRAEDEATPRYRVLETTRLFALERLIESGEAASVRRLHLEHFAERAEDAIARMLVADPLGLAFFDRERDNLLLALAWPHGDESGAGLRLAAAMRYYWPSRGMLSFGMAAMRSALARPHAGHPSAARCHVLGSMAHFASLMGDADAARGHIDEALAQARSLGDPRCLCVGLAAAGFIYLQRGDIAHAREFATEAMDLGREIGDGHELGNAISAMSAVHRHAGESELSRRVQEEGVALRQRLHQSWSEAVGRINLASMAIDADDPEAARTQLVRILELMREVDSEQIGLYSLGITAERCASVGMNEAAVLLEAARVSQYRRVGMGEALDARRVERFALARSRLDAATLEQAERLGASLTYVDAMLRMRECVSGEPGR